MAKELLKQTVLAIVNVSVELDRSRTWERWLQRQQELGRPSKQHCPLPQL
jgi:hypothetical protein